MLYLSKFDLTRLTNFQKVQEIFLFQGLHSTFNSVLPDGLCAAYLKSTQRVDPVDEKVVYGLWLTASTADSP